MLSKDEQHHSIDMPLPSFINNYFGFSQGGEPTSFKTKSSRFNEFARSNELQRCFGPYFIILAKNQSSIFPTFSTLLIKVAKQKLKKQILPIPTATNILQSSEQKNKTKKVKSFGNRQPNHQQN